MLSTDRSLFKGEAPRLSSDFAHPLSSEKPFKFPRHLVSALEIDWIIAMSANIFIAPYLTLIRAAGGVYDFRNFEEV